MEPQFSLFFLVYFTILGMIFGSFSSVLIYRWENGITGIWTGRSKCPGCGHILTSRELIPVLSFLLQRGKCSHCKNKIPLRYPLYELFMGISFGIGGCVIMREGIHPLSWISLATLIYIFITVIYVCYDLLYTKIPDQALIPGIYVALVLGGVEFYNPTIKYLLIPSIKDGLWAAFILYSFFYIQILIPGVWYCLKEKKIQLATEVVLGYFLFLIHILSFGYFPRSDEHEDEEEIPTWIGHGDLRIALFIGLTLGVTHSISTLIFAYILGSLFGLCYLYKTKNRYAQIPFGPFLGIGWLLSIIFYSEISQYISNLLY